MTTGAFLLIVYVLGALAILLALHFGRRRLDCWQHGVPHQLVREQPDAQASCANKEATSTERFSNSQRKHRGTA